jgi:hypothetical protein
VNILDYIALPVAGYLFVRFFDRLRRLSWRNNKPLYVSLYLSHVLWTIGILWDALHDGMQIHQWVGLVAMYCMLEITKRNWAGPAPPVDTLSRPAPLGPPEDRP